MGVRRNLHRTAAELAIAEILLEMTAKQGSSRIAVDEEKLARRLRAKGYDPDTGKRGKGQLHRPLHHHQCHIISLFSAASERSHVGQHVGGNLLGWSVS